MTWSYSLDKFATIINTQPPGDPSRVERISTDTRTLQEGDVFVALTGERYDGNDFLEEAFEKGAVAAVCTEAIPIEVCLVVDDPLEALQRFASYHRAYFTMPLIAITGSCGKTSCKDLIAGVLASKYTVTKSQGNLNNEIGCPLSLIQLNDDTERAVIELGANHPGEIAKLCAISRPTESAITMIGWAHLEGFGGIEEVAQAKAEIVEGLPPDGIFYVNASDSRCLDIAERFEGEKIYFGADSQGFPEATAGGPYNVMLRDWEFRGAGMRLDVDPVGELVLPLYARAYVGNVLLAIAVGLKHGIEAFQDPLQKACSTLTRLRLLQAGSIEVLDDTYNANPSSMMAALDGLGDRPAAGARVAALGAMFELGDAAAEWHAKVGAHAGKTGVQRLFARGPHAQKMVSAALAAGVAEAAVVEKHETMAGLICEAATPGDVVLIKGSRAMEMEKVVSGVLARMGGGNDSRSAFSET